MEDERELIRKIKNSRKMGMTPPQITRKLQERGLKLEYIDVLIKKAYPNKAIWIITSLLFVIIMLSFIVVYLLFFQSGVKQDIPNPLAGFEVSFNGQQQTQTPQTPSGSIDLDQTQTPPEELTQINVGDIELETEFFSFILNEIGAYDLHKNPFTFEKPVIEFKVEEEYYYSIISGEGIETFEGQAPEDLIDNPDLRFISPQPEIIRAILADDTGEYITQSITDGETQIEQIASEQELFTKGYLEIYNSLMST